MTELQYKDRSEKYRKYAQFYHTQARVNFRLGNYYDVVLDEQVAEDMEEAQIYWLRRAENVNSQPNQLKGKLENEIQIENETVR